MTTSRPTTEKLLWIVASLLVFSQLRQSPSAYLSPAPAPPCQTIEALDLSISPNNISHSAVPQQNQSAQSATNFATRNQSTSLSPTSAPRSQNALSPTTQRNLVAFTALGLDSAIGTVHFNVLHHFPDWDCIVFIHSAGLKTNETKMQEVSQHCTLVRLPGNMWTHFLLTLTPELTLGYDHIAVVLDDVFAPTEGNLPVSVPRLLRQMQEYNLSTISPAIKGSAWSATKPKGKKCLFRSHLVETFFQIFRRDLFQCLRSNMEYSNPQATCLDLCLERKLCPGIANNTMAVDSSMTAYHLGRECEYLMNTLVRLLLTQDPLSSLSRAPGSLSNRPGSSVCSSGESCER